MIERDKRQGRRGVTRAHALATGWRGGEGRGGGAEGGAGGGIKGEHKTAFKKQEGGVMARRPAGALRGEGEEG